MLRHYLRIRETIKNRFSSHFSRTFHSVIIDRIHHGLKHLLLRVLIVPRYVGVLPLRDDYFEFILIKLSLVCVYRVIDFVGHRLFSL